MSRCGWCGRESSYLVRKLGQMPFALYASSDYAALRQPDNWTFIAYDAQFSDMPQQRWLLDIAGQRAISCELSDISSHLAAARAGAGVAGLPCLAITAPSCCGWNTAGPRSRATSGWWCIATCAVPRPCGPSWTLSPIPSRRNQASALDAPGPALATRRHEPPRPGAGRVGPRPAGWPARAGTIAASPGSANPPHQHTPCRNPFRSATAMCLAAISPVLSPTLKCCPAGHGRAACLKASR